MMRSNTCFTVEHRTYCMARQHRNQTSVTNQHCIAYGARAARITFGNLRVEEDRQPIGPGL